MNEKRKRLLALALCAGLLGCASCTRSPVGEETPAETQADEVRPAQQSTDAAASGTADDAPAAEVNESFTDSDTADITDDLEDLGLLGGERWDNSSPANVVSRNPHDMAVFDGRLYISCGSFQDNTGPVTVYAYSNDTDAARSTGILPTEQTDELFIYGDTLFALSTDQQEWMVSDVYYLPKGEEKFRTAARVLPGCYHCFDMEQYHGSLFFAGCSVSASGKYKASVFRMDCDIRDAQKSPVTDLKIVDRDGKLLDYDDDKQEGAARFYELFIFQDTLYGLYSSSLIDPDRCGFYRYDEDAGAFVQADDVNAQPILDKIFAATADSSRISACFTYRDRQYFLTEMTDDTLYVTDDLRHFSTVPIGTVTDIIFRGGIPYLLTVQKEEDGWLNTVYRTEDFETFEQVHFFRSPLYARRMECLGSAYYFTLGVRATFSTHSANSSPMPVHYEKCGTVLRYIPD